MHRSWISSRGKPQTSSPSRRRARWLAAVAALTLPVAVLTAPLALAGTTPPFTIGPANAAVVPGADASITLADLSGNNKELGPKNASTTKIGVIHNAVLPMLDLTNPNGQVDLRQAWLGSAKDSDKDDWVYFAWERDAANGSGFIAYEFMKNAAPAACNFDGSVSDTTLIATCNPWKNRASGDFMILWDQQGGSKDLWLRTWSGTGSNLTLSAPVLIPASYGQAEYSSDGFRGEAAVNITDAIYGGVQQCLSFANVIPSTVTGNSDSADYKDTIFRSGISLGGCTTTTTTTPKQSDGTTNVPAAGLPITTAGVVQVKDSASITLTGGAAAPGGTVAFSLCKASNAANATCDGTATPIGSPVTVTGSAFPATVVSPSAWVTSAGRFCWQAVYSGVTASGIAGSSDVSTGECFVVTPVSPTLTTTASAGVVVGGTVSDQAILGGTAPQPTAAVIHTSAPDPATRTAAGGSITFKLYGPSDSACGPLVYDSSTKSPSENATVSGNATYNSASFAPATVGTYHWVASYSGSSPNTSTASHNASGTCPEAAESVVVGPDTPTIATSATTTKVLGDAAGISDTATISDGYFPVGSTPGNVTFSLYGPFAANHTIVAADCVNPATGVTGNRLYANTVAAARTNSTTASATSGSYVPDTPGKYAWVASYAGNAENNAVSGTCGDANEGSIITKAPASLTTAQSLRPQDSVTVAATVGGTPTGTVTFKLYGPNNATCDPAGAAPVYTESAVGLNAGGSAVTSNATFAVSSASASQYKWLVSYSGDDNHLPISGSCGSENFLLTITNGSAVTS